MKDAQAKKEKPSALKREHPALLKSFTFFLFLWVFFALLDLDPANQINADRDPGSDPQPCLKALTQLSCKALSHPLGQHSRLAPALPFGGLHYRLAASTTVWFGASTTV
jgi:hypothetical protein